tara:strand:- start:11 stop:352 length:342 start_codon:yes stop_codon:yes gene_type:complete
MFDLYMCFEIFKIFILSVILIICIHYLYIFFKTNLTVPKIKDLVHQPKLRYKKIYEIIGEKTPKKEDTTREEDTAMKDELKTYIHNLSNTSSNNTLQFENITSNIGFNHYESV